METGVYRHQWSMTTRLICLVIDSSPFFYYLFTISVQNKAAHALINAHPLFGADLNLYQNH